MCYTEVTKDIQYQGIVKLGRDASMPPGIGLPELVLVLFIVIIVFGVGKLPELGGALGKGIREFRGAVRDAEPDDKQHK